jgi:(S)-ureidoglycine aminohydrolase
MKYFASLMARMLSGRFGKKPVFILLALFLSTSAIAQKDSVRSMVYSWQNLKPVKEETRVRRQVLDGSTTHLQNLEIHATTLEPGQAPHPPHVHADEEELIIVKEGKLSVTINGKTEELGAGSVAMAMPGDEHGFNNTGSSRATYYVIKYKARAPLDSARARNAGGSFMINWKDVPATPNEKGSRRHFFERPTAMSGRYEMHVTTLNGGLQSHNPHTHVAEEIILMIQGKGTMQIGQNFYRANAGDLIFLNSQVPHAFKNTTDLPATYFAFQWTPGE